MQAIRGASRVLRNSDHVPPTAKIALLDEVVRSWQRVCQLLMVVAPILASKGTAKFEDIRFVLTGDFDVDDRSKRLSQIIGSIPSNVVKWYQEDVFSRKMGMLLIKHADANQGDLSEFLLLLLMVRQRPSGWEKQIEKFIVREKKNSFYLGEVFHALRRERELSFSTERTRQDLRRLAAMTVAKHIPGVKHPNTKLVEEAAKELDKQES